MMNNGAESFETVIADLPFGHFVYFRLKVTPIFRVRMQHNN